MLYERRNERSGFVLLDGKALHGLFAQAINVLQQTAWSQDVCRAYRQQNKSY